MAIANNDKANATIGKPVPGGAIFIAPLGTPLPDGVPSGNPSADLDEAFVNLGYCSEDGLTKTTTEEGDDLKAWGGDIVMHNATSVGITYNTNLIETVNEDVLRFIHGKENVTKRDDGVLMVDETLETLPHFIMAVYTLQGNGDDQRIKRQIVGDAQLTDRSGDESNNDSDILSYPSVITAFKFIDPINNKQKFVRTEYSPKVASTTAVNSVAVSPTTASVAVNATKKLASVVKPDGATNKSVTWSSDKADIATVDASGTVTGKKAGTAVIKATSVADTTKSGNCTVTVTAS